MGKDERDRRKGQMYKIGRNMVIENQAALGSSGYANQMLTRLGGHNIHKKPIRGQTLLQ